MKTKKLSAQQLRLRGHALWQEIPLTSWLQFLNEVKPRPGIELEVKGESILTNCVEHQDNSPSMHINIAKGFVHCFSCRYHERDAIAFSAKYIGRDKSVAIKQIQSLLNVKLVSPAEARQIDEDTNYTKMKNCLAIIINDELIDARNTWESVGRVTARLADTEYYNAEEALSFIDSRVGLDNIIKLPIGIVPTIKRIWDKADQLVDPRTRKSMCPPYMIDQMEKYIKDYSTPTTIGKVMFPYHAAPGVVSRFRIRLPDSDDGVKTFISIKDEREPNLGFYGLDMYGDFDQRDEDPTSEPIILEGEFDVLKYRVEAVAQGNSDLILLAHGGSGNTTFPELKLLNIKKVRYLPDYDKGGITNVKDVLKSNPEYDFKIFNWPADILDPSKNGTDLDDSVRLHGFEKVHAALTDWDKSWVHSTYWCREQVKSLIRSTNIEEDQESVRKVIFDYAKCLGAENKDKSATAINWIKTSLEDYGFAQDLSKKLANDYLAQGTPEGLFRLNLERKLQERYFFIGLDHRRSTLPIHAWDRIKKFSLEIRMSSDSHIKASLAVSLGSLVDWVTEELSIPDFIKMGSAYAKNDEQEISIVDQEEKIAKFVFLALKAIAGGLRPLSDYDYHSSGNHWLKTKDDGMCMFNVNGTKVYRAILGEDKVEKWELLDSPIFEGYYFDSSKTPWTPNITDIASLQKKPVMNLSESYNLAVGIIDAGWSFKSQWADSRTLGASVVASSICKLFNMNVQFLATNERSTGKSTLCAEALGGGKNTDIRLVEHSKYYDNATAAGVRQNADGSSLWQIFDEVDNESGDRGRAHKNEELMTILRTSSSGDGKYLQGTASGDPRVFRLNFWAIVCGINPGISEANMTRFFTIDLKSGLDGRLPPRTSILRKYTIADIDKLRKTVTVDRYDDIPHILRCHKLISEASDKDPDLLGRHTMQRTKDTLKVFASIIMAAGDDWKRWVTETLASKNKALKSLTKRTSNESLVKTILHTPSIEIGKIITRRMMVAQFFTTTHIETDRAALNRSGCGVTLHKNSETCHWYLIIVWQEALRGVLKGTSILKTKDDPHLLQEIASRHPICMDEDAASDLLANVLFEVPAYVEDVPYSILNVTEYVAKEEKRRQRARTMLKEKYKEPDPLVSMD